MQIRIPAFLAKAWDASMDGIARALLPPPKPTGLRILGYDVDWTDIGELAWALVIAAALAFYYHTWWTFPAVMLFMTGAIAFSLPGTRRNQCGNKGEHDEKSTVG